MDQIQFWIRDRVHVLTLQLVYQANKAIHPTRHGKIYLIFKSEQSKQKKSIRLQSMESHSFLLAHCVALGE